MDLKINACVCPLAYMFLNHGSDYDETLVDSFVAYVRVSDSKSPITKILLFFNLGTYNFWSLCFIMYLGTVYCYSTTGVFWRDWLKSYHGMSVRILISHMSHRLILEEWIHKW